MAELLPDNARGTGSTIASMGMCVGSFIVTKTFLNLQLSIGIHGFYWFYSGVCLLATLFVFFFVPETKGLPLEELAKLFKPKKRQRSEPAEKLENLIDKFHQLDNRS